MNMYEAIDGIVERTRAAMIEDCRTEISDKAAGDIAADYLDTLAVKIRDEIKTYLRAYNDFKK